MEHGLGVLAGVDMQLGTRATDSMGQAYSFRQQLKEGHWYWRLKSLAGGHSDTSRPRRRGRSSCACCSTVWFRRPEGDRIACVHGHEVVSITRRAA